MIDLLGFITGGKNFVLSIIVIIIVFLVVNILTSRMEKSLLKKAKTKKHKSNVKILSKIIKYILIFFVILFFILSISGSLTAIGLSFGFISAALGFALQRPISGVAGWLMVVIKRPFEIGDRINMGGVKGDVIELTLTHVFLEEVGGTIASDVNSGRIIMIPNSKLFEENIANYTKDDEYLLDEITYIITFKSDLDAAEKIGIDCAIKYCNLKKEYYTRTFIDTDGMKICLRYFVKAKERQVILSKISKEIYKEVSKNKKVEFAFRHLQLVK